MKIQILKRTDKTITCIFYMKDKILQGRIWKSKHFHLWRVVNKKSKLNDIIYISDFADYVDRKVHLYNSSVFSGFDKLAHMILKVPDSIPAQKIESHLRKSKEPINLPDLSMLSKLNEKRN